jgi:hypothetical protein
MATAAMTRPSGSLPRGVAEACFLRPFFEILGAARTANTDREIPMKMAGRIPARKSPPIDMLATKPRMIMLTQGGMVSPMTAVAASRATASASSLPACR